MKMANLDGGASSCATSPSGVRSSKGLNCLSNAKVADKPFEAETTLT